MFRLLSLILLIETSLFKQFEALSNEDNFLLVISLDGFRYDYLDKYSNKEGFLYQLGKNGSRACWSDSIFPSNTYPNHWSIVTGLYPDSTGVINNDIYDPDTKQQYRMYRDNEDKAGWFQEAEPVWVTNHKSNPGKHSVIFDWPGSPAKFSQSLDYEFRQIFMPNLNITTFNKTIDQFVESISVERTNLGVLYLGEPDLSGHVYGPESKQVEDVVKQLDHVLDYLFRQLALKKNLSLLGKEGTRLIDLIILTDHGMQSIRTPDSDQHIDLDRLLFLSINFKV